MIYLQSTFASRSVLFEPNDAVDQDEVGHRDDAREDDRERLRPTRLKEVVEEVGSIRHKNLIRHFDLKNADSRTLYLEIKK